MHKYFSQQGKIFQHGQTPRKITHEAFTFCINEANHSLISGSQDCETQEHYITYTCLLHFDT